MELLHSFAVSDEHWTWSGSTLSLRIDRKTGCIDRLETLVGERKIWMEYPGDVTVRDDLLEHTFGRAHLSRLEGHCDGSKLTLVKRFHGAPWTLEETYESSGDDLSWKTVVRSDAGAPFRSCAISWTLPWPKQIHAVSFWAAKDNMPSQPNRYADIALEYGEITSGILMPALSCYREKTDAGIVLAMPFDFKTPRFRFVSAFRERELRVEFDFLALSEKHQAETSLLLHGTVGDWRPALGWLYDRFREYFEPRSQAIGKLWGGHICGQAKKSAEDIRKMRALDLQWYEIHGHFPAYGNYHPEDLTSWRSGHFREDETLISVDTVRQTIRTLHEEGAAAFPYLQVTGDGDEKLLAPEMESCRIRNLHGETWGGWPGTLLMNSDPALPFGRDITRQIDGMVERYPEMDGVFLDQPCYNFVDTAHYDGVTAIHNRPAYMTGFNYFVHLEHLSRRLHPRKTIIANGPFGVGILKYFDACMAESDSWLCDHLQYYAIGTKPLFFLMYACDDAHLELMFQQALLHGAGFSSYPEALRSKDLYDRYVPLLRKLYRRRWVFDPRPLCVPAGFQGNVYRGENGSLYVSLVREMSRLPGRDIPDVEVRVHTADTAKTRALYLQEPGGDPRRLDFSQDNGDITFSIPGGTVASLAELILA